MCSLISGCRKSEPPIVHKLSAPPDVWSITNFEPTAEAPALLWNGLIGIRSKAFPEKDSPPLFDIAEYDQEGEEKIRSLPNPINIQWALSPDQPALGLKEASGYSEIIFLKNGGIKRSWTWTTDQGELNCKQEISIDPVKRRVASKWTFVSDRYLVLWCVMPKISGGQVQAQLHDTQIQNLRLGDSPYQMGLQYAGDHRRSVPGADDLGTWQEGKAIFGLEKDQPLEVWQVLQVATEPDLVHPGPRAAAEQVQQAAADYWEKAWQTDIEIEGPVEDQQFIRSALFYLRSAIHPEGKMSISPMGLSSDIYFGHVFWDADVWVFPAITLIAPQSAKAIAEYRLRRSYEFRGGFNQNPAYGRNMAEWLAQERPIGTGKLGKPTKPVLWPESQLKVPWESSVTGKETVPGPSRFQDHITGTVQLMLNQASSLDLVEQANVSRFTRGATDFYLQRITKRADGKYDLRGTMSPDENHTGDNDLYTNLIAQRVLNDGLWKSPKDQIPQLHLPKDEKTFLTYDNDPVRGYKQAAAVLSIYPLQYPPAEKQAKAMMERFSDKVTQNGPAMTDSIHALIWARLGEAEKGYEAWHESWKPFVKPPFLLFSEKRRSSRTYFTTGAAGSLQTVLYGFAGLRIDSKRAPNAKWSLPLRNGQVISIAPNLPPKWKKLTLRNLTILNKKYTFEITSNDVMVTQTSNR